MTKKSRTIIAVLIGLAIISSGMLIGYLLMRPDKQITTSNAAKTPQQTSLTGTLLLVPEKGRPTNSEGNTVFTVMLKTNDNKHYLIWSDPEIPTLTKAAGMKEPTIRAVGDYENNPFTEGKEYKIPADGTFRAREVEILSTNP